MLIGKTGCGSRLGAAPHSRMKVPRKPVSSACLSVPEQCCYGIRLRPSILASKQQNGSSVPGSSPRSSRIPPPCSAISSARMVEGDFLVSSCLASARAVVGSTWRWRFPFLPHATLVAEKERTAGRGSIHWRESGRAIRTGTCCDMLRKIWAPVSHERWVLELPGQKFWAGRASHVTMIRADDLRASCGQLHRVLVHSRTALDWKGRFLLALYDKNVLRIIVFYSVSRRIAVHAMPISTTFMIPPVQKIPSYYTP